MNEAFIDCGKRATDAILENMHAAQALEPFPSYVEDGDDAVFVSAMQENGRLNKLSQIVKALEANLASADDTAKSLMVPIERVVPAYDQAKIDIKRFLTVCTLTTCLRILQSKAAKSRNQHLKESVDATLQFCADLDVPQSVVRRMQDLSKAIASASKADKRSRSPKRKM